jgi:Probable cobalt transporter subunit (CbtA)
VSLLTFIGRGGLAGACAGLLSGLVSTILAEPIMDRAIVLEHAHAAAGEDHGAELFTRSTQHVGLLVATTLTGLSLGLIFGVVYAVLHRHDRTADPWGRALRLAGAGFLAVSLLPFVRYPANPPGVGDPATVQARTAGWLAAIALGLATVVCARQLGAWLVHRNASLPVRQLAPVGVVLLGLAVLFLLPGSPDAVEVPADLLWTFRLLSLLASAVIWAGLGVGFGLAGLRRAAAVPQPA